MATQLKRRQARINAFIALFEASFGQELDEVLQIAREEAAEYAVDDFGENLLRFYTENSRQVDNLIQGKLKGWKFTRLPKVNLAILRLAVSEMLITQGDKDSIIINEAVEIAKIYGDEMDYQFINGVLGSLSRESKTQAGMPETDTQQ